MALSPEMQKCIDACLDCYKTCLGMAMNHCLEAGGEHVAPPHFRLMMACAEMCRTSAHFMLISSPHHKQTCRECAEICTECAKDCERLDGMEDCVAACRACADSCSAMAA
ncbi:ferredoxin [Afipia sp. Root123D2]|uniref:four-helix bundle copper-binding protein n=1 Tax=Afipia sp. Root123D2 TaxID=1736436 RepID=UPI0006FAE28E|nr:four-helix bundle copper-binding protein [Afipia sp. Root123D2]KQW18131.1 ferredoxin [Afipia sp. Root123D2]